jgi:hypothetical protein
MRSRSWRREAIAPRAVGQRGGFQRIQLFVVGMVLGVGLTACHTGPIVPAQSLVAQDPLDRIAVQVMTAGTHRYCAKVWLGGSVKRNVFGCIAHVGDTTLYYYQDYYQEWTGPILVAGRIWTARSGTVMATDQALQTQFTHAYGMGRDCVGRKLRAHTRYHQWHASSFMVVLRETRAESTTGPWTGEADFGLLYIKGEATYCQLMDPFYLGPRALGIG